jgi:RHS repeat-associated protein
MYTEAGVLAWKAQLDLYGVPTMHVGTRGDCPWRWPGQYEDEETGLYYNRFRYYDTGRGGYLSQDPIGLRGGLAPYGYVEDPLAQTDVFGLSGDCGKPNEGTYGELRAAGAKDAHHVIQDAAVRDLPGYSRRAAPAVQLLGPSTQVGSPHYLATQVQRQAGGGTYAAERRIGYKSLRQGGFSKADARANIERADAYFKSLGVSDSHQYPDTRKQVKFMNPELKTAVRHVIEDLVARRYEKLVRDGRCGRLSEHEIARAIGDYGSTLVQLPEEAWALVEVFQQLGPRKEVMLDVPLWTLEEGRSDLTLSLTATQRGPGFDIEIDDIHVL